MTIFVSWLTSNSRNMMNTFPRNQSVVIDGYTGTRKLIPVILTTAVVPIIKRRFDFRLNISFASTVFYLHTLSKNQIHFRERDQKRKKRTTRSYEKLNHVSKLTQSSSHLNTICNHQFYVLQYQGMLHGGAVNWFKAQLLKTGCRTWCFHSHYSLPYLTMP